MATAALSLVVVPSVMNCPTSDDLLRLLESSVGNRVVSFLKSVCGLLVPLQFNKDFETKPPASIYDSHALPFLVLDGTVSRLLVDGERESTIVS